ncbi:unnamed protein product [Owenia fusiformis]|uniref:RNA-binding protein NOB1 n=1 Tax=Owenia fusiformis TaxID=6347 RepID=A0A8J1XTC9_OWEFU|nr:unnamed protein product [Owenia fusiformis]
MKSMAEMKVKHVVADSGAFLRNAALHDIGEKVYSIPEVVQEIRDKETKQRLQVLPYELVFREPSTQSIHIVSEFAKKTGDYRSLSAVDIKVLALTYQLEKEQVGIDHIKTQPERKATWTSSKRTLEKPSQIAGFYLRGVQNKIVDGDQGSEECKDDDSNDCKQPGDITSKQEQTDHSTIEAQTENLTLENNQTQHPDKDTVTEKDKTNTESQTDRDTIKPEVSDSTVLTPKTCENDNENNETLKLENDVDGALIKEGDIKEEEEDDESDEEAESDDDDDDAGWITPSNIKRVREAMGDKNVEKASVEVGCLTTDFAMQNVLIQMGLNVISVDGMLIRKAKSYVLRCFACMKITTLMMKEFCPHCGNATLQKLAMSVDDEGVVHYHFSKRRQHNIRGMRYSLPMPKGGKHVTNPILCEDQPTGQHRTNKHFNKGSINPMDADFVSQSSPFALNDVYSRSAQIRVKGGRGRGRGNKKNPNENRKVYGRRK